MEEIAIAKFKATCLAVLREVNETGRPVLVTKRGVPVAQVVAPSNRTGKPRELGTMAGRIATLGDIVSPASDPEDWAVFGE
ncbi:MAG: type II toxin-antitoxin system Phd/YefM family antitoxin [Actinomycetota bacterium]